MPLRNPFASYNASSNIEAHLVCGLLRDAGIAAEVIEDLSLGGLYTFGTIAELHKPQVWIERADIERAGPILAEYDRHNAHRKSARAESQATVEATCDSCGKISIFDGSRNGTTQSCLHCRAFIDVGDSVEIEGWDADPRAEDEA